MFGLTKLMREVDPQTTLEKATFLFRNVFDNANVLTTTISFSALFTLVALRHLKTYFKNIWYIYRIPEVLVVVIVSTGMLSSYSYR